MSYPVFYKKSDGTYAPIPYTYNETAGSVTPTAPPVANTELKIVKATASGSEAGNGPENAIDKNEETRWSAQGLGEKLNLDLGATQEISSVDITWFKGNERSSKADIQIDGTKIASVVSDGTNPKTLTPITPPRKGNMVTIVGQGNSQNDWNSITTAKVMGRQLQAPTTPTEPTPTPTPPTPTPEPPAQGGMDKFGIKMIYPTKSGGRVFNAPFDTGNKRTLNSGQRDGNSDLKPLGSAKYTIDPAIKEMIINGGAPRVYVFDEPRTKMFENVEVTCYYKRISGTPASYQGFEIGARGEHELGGTNNARVYYARVSINGAWDRMKEDTHPSGLATSTVKKGVAFNTNTWYGMKLILRTLKDKSGVKIEAYRDETDGKNGGTWIKMDDWTDKASAGWGGYPIYIPTTARCGCHSVFARTDNATDFRIKNFTIREVDPLP